MADIVFAHLAKPRLLVLLVAFGILAACGGGGGSPGATSTSALALTFPINIAIRNLVTNGYSATLTVDGNINGAFATGTGNAAWTPAVPSTFEHRPVFDAVATDNETITAGGITQFLPSTAHQYFSIVYEPLGRIDAESGEYTVVTSFSGWPLAARVGDSGALGATTIFSDSGKLAVVGKEQLSYAIENDTVDSNAAILVLASVRTDNVNNVVLRTFVRYRVTASGAVSPVSTHYVISEPGLDANLMFTVVSIDTPLKIRAPGL